ncbi:S-adenosyl-L-methionine-dependent methyltransferase, partial [Ramaria rubella]
SQNMPPESSNTWSAELYQDSVPFVFSPEFTSNILQLLDAKPGEKIWDFGCGSGEVTLELQSLVGDNGLVVGVDSSASMVEQARAKGIKYTILGDVQDPNQEELQNYKKSDAVFSNAALHWCKQNPGGVLESAKQVLRPGGRFVAEFGGWTNCIAATVEGIRSALHGVLRKHSIDPLPRDPWYFPSTEDYQEESDFSSFQHGFRICHISLNPRITPLKGDIKDWLNVFCRGNFLKNMDEKEADIIMNEVNDLCAVDCRDSRGRWSVMYTRLRVVATYQ